MGNGIFSTDHNRWKQQKKLIMSTCHFEDTQKFIPIIDIAARRAVEKLEAHANGKTPICIIQ